ncbi:hypothetical protein [Emticicia sp. BO119]|uniref:hypothetical protein n=1 Tax=Emticicia sp. BO119 TaxID=2757768 RepID=UPI0015F0CD37|nr:hypothetical protein [Emticicia sp. BO119]MBA4849466.1 hypothetical protein [Emticicia sp. BO119]
MSMTLNTELTLIDKIQAALKTRNKDDLKAVTYLLRIKCHQSGTDMLEFLADKIFVPSTALETDKSDFACPYCPQDSAQVYNGFAGLKTHISKKHSQHFQEWKKTINPVHLI